MNYGRLLLAVIASFAVIFAFDFLFHNIYMGELYGQYKSIWRPESEMMAHMPFMTGGQLLLALCAAVLYSCGRSHCVITGLKFGAVLGVLAASTSVTWYALLPIPMEMLLKWLVGGFASGLLVGLVLGLVYAPVAAKASEGEENNEG